jgi:hypothetical protein
VEALTDRSVRFDLRVAQARDAGVREPTRPLQARLTADSADCDERLADRLLPPSVPDKNQ